jgi:predicted transcriptional regulator
MPDVAIYQQIAPRIQAIFRSELMLHLILSLHEGAKPLSRLSEEIGSSANALLPKVKVLEEKGLVAREEGQVSLTPIGAVVASKTTTDIIRVLDSRTTIFEEGHFAEDPKLAPGAGEEKAGAEVAAVLYRRHRGEIHRILRSRLLTLLLLVLNQGERTRDELKAITGTSSQNLRPALRRLIEKEFVEERPHGYALTPYGSVVAESLSDFVMTTAVVIRFKQFWNAHAMDWLPDVAVDHLGELIGGSIISNPRHRAFSAYTHMMKCIREAERLAIITSVAHPDMMAAIAKKALGGMPLDVIITPEMEREIDSARHRPFIQPLEGCRNIRIAVAQVPLKGCILLSDRCLNFGLNFIDEDLYDSLRFFHDTSDEGRRWGERLRHYYREHSVPHNASFAPEKPGSP